MMLNLNLQNTKCPLISEDDIAFKLKSVFWVDIVKAVAYIKLEGSLVLNKYK